MAPTSMSAQPHGCFGGPLPVAFDGFFDAAGSGFTEAGEPASPEVGPVRSFSGVIPLLRAAVCKSRNSPALTNGTKALPLANTRPLGTLAASARSTSVLIG